jgi:hypothetical protein
LRGGASTPPGAPAGIDSSSEPPYSVPFEYPGAAGTRFSRYPGGPIPVADALNRLQFFDSSPWP